MSSRHSPWPRPALTEDEAKGCALYRTPSPDGSVIPGLLRRVYPFQLSTTLFAGESNVLTTRFVTSGLRTLLFGMTFSGDIEFWSLQVVTASGELLFDTTPVAALLNLAGMDGSSQGSPAGIAGGGAAQAALSLQRSNAEPLIWDPPWLIDGTQALTLTGAALTSSYVATNTQRGVLNVAFHVWEIPAPQGNRGPNPLPPPAGFPPRPPVPPLRALPTSRPGPARVAGGRR